MMSVYRPTTRQLGSRGDVEAVLFARRRLAISPHARQNDLVQTIFEKVGRKPYSYSVAAGPAFDMQTRNLELLIAPNAADHGLVAGVLLFLNPKES
jgi:hypothetical protein